MLDKAIEMNFRLIKNDIIALLGVGTIITAFAIAQSLFILFAPFVFLIFTCVMTYKVYYKILYKTVFGEGNALYGALPITAEEHIWSKIITILLFQVIDAVFTVVCFFVATKFGVMILFEDMALNLLEMVYNETGFVMEVFLGIVFWISITSQLIIVFYINVLFNKNGGKSRNIFLPVFAAYLIFNNLINTLELQFADMKYLLIIAIVATVIEVIAGVVLYRKLVTYFKNEYVPG